ncbi:MAG: hypothetical protein HUJ78_06655, partial [Mogibacterium sp.]|nr:hypothetical protein [Mogibacterium sp.]
ITVIGGENDLNYDSMIEVFAQDGDVGRTSVSTELDSIHIQNADNLIKTGTITRIEDCFDMVNINGISISELIKNENSVSIEDKEILCDCRLNPDTKEIYNIIDIAIVAADGKGTIEKKNNNYVIRIKTNTDVNIEKLLK